MGDGLRELSTQGDEDGGDDEEGHACESPCPGEPAVEEELEETECQRGRKQGGAEPAEDLHPANIPDCGAPRPTRAGRIFDHSTIN